MCYCLMSVYLSCFFFFFKQKTAYEMRISDWSSDVCSSDLLGTIRHPEISSIMLLRNSNTRWGAVSQFLHWLILVLIVVMAVLGQIGRASCRERVCQYV